MLKERVSKTIHISDTIHGSIPISSFEKKIISTRIFNRLHNISQNSTAYLTYPTNRTRRFEHSIGTMHLCSQMLVYGCDNADKDTTECFFSDFEKELRDILQSKLKNDGDSIYREKLGDINLSKKTLFKYEKITITDYIYSINIPKTLYDSKKEVLYTILLQAVRLAGMLHDIGHPPMSHITESALTKLWKDTKEKADENDRYMEFYECLEVYSSKDEKNSQEKNESIQPRKRAEEIELHERIGNMLTKKLLEYTVSKCTDEENESDVLAVLFELLVMDVTISILSERTVFFKWLHRIIDGSLDCDRLDYVSRDPINSGLDTGKIEYGRLMSTMRLIKHEDGSYWICSHIKMIDIIDDYFYRRWALYKKIIFHHRVVKTDYLLENCIEEISKDYLNNTIVREERDSEDSENILPYNISGVWKAVKAQPSYNAFFDTVLQWDDDWLLTILKKHYYSEYKKNKNNTYYKLEELISNKKSFYSLLKKDADVMLLDTYIMDVLNSRRSETEKLMEELTDTYNPGEKKDWNHKISLNVDPFIGEIKGFIDYIDERAKAGTGNGSNILSMFRFNLGVLLGGDVVYNNIIHEALDRTLEGNTEIRDYFFQFKQVKTGINKNLMLYSEDYKGRTKTYKYIEISDTNKVLEIRRNALIPVYIYLRKKDDKVNIEFSSIIKALGTNLGNGVSVAIENKIKDLLKSKMED